MSKVCEADRALVRAITLQQPLQAPTTDAQADVERLADYAAAFREHWVALERERLIGVLEAVAGHHEIVRNMVQWFREGEP